MIKFFGVGYEIVLLFMIFVVKNSVCVWNVEGVFKVWLYIILFKIDIK